MPTALQLEQLAKLIKDTELRLAKFAIVARDTSEDIEKLETVEKGLEENIEYLKQSAPSVSAPEFKKIKADLARIRGRISLLRMDLSKCYKAEEQCQKYLEEIKQEYTDRTVIKSNVVSFRGKKS